MVSGTSFPTKLSWRVFVQWFIAMKFWISCGNEDGVFENEQTKPESEPQQMIGSVIFIYFL